MNVFSRCRLVLRLLLLAGVGFSGLTAVSNAEEPLVPPGVRSLDYYIFYRVHCNPCIGTDTLVVRLGPSVDAMSPKFASAMEAEQAADSIINNTCDPNDSVQSCKSAVIAVSSGNPPPAHPDPSVFCPCYSYGMIHYSADGFQSGDSCNTWLVEYTCTGKSGGSVTVQSWGKTYCEAYRKSRSGACAQINSKYFGGACCCRCKIIKRPTCSCDRIPCR